MRGAKLLRSRWPYAPQGVVTCGVTCSYQQACSCRAGGWSDPCVGRGARWSGVSKCVELSARLLKPFFANDADRTRLPSATLPTERTKSSRTAKKNKKRELPRTSPKTESLLSQTPTPGRLLSSRTRPETTRQANSYTPFFSHATTESMLEARARVKLDAERHPPFTPGSRASPTHASRAS